MRAKVFRSVVVTVMVALGVPIVVATHAAAASATQVTAGAHHTCAVQSGNGAIRCWGLNNHGQLGDASYTNRLAPVGVYGLQNGATQVDAGAFYTCALLKFGAVKCWGQNDHGQLGTGNDFEQWVPVQVVGLTSGVSAIAAGSAHACALTASGGVKCWGINDRGQLGLGDTVDRWTPTDVPGLSSGVVAISAGAAQTCALTDAGAVKCWGANPYGEIGDGTTTNSLTPVDVVGMSSGVAKISAGFAHTCAVTLAGAAYCWGQNLSGGLGDGTTTDSAVPVAVAGLGSGVASISAGGLHSCALTTAGGVKCWGNNSAGQVGDGTSTMRLVPVDVGGSMGGIASITTALFHYSCEVLTGGAIKCWGYNGYGQLGNGKIANVNPVPGYVSGFSK